MTPARQRRDTTTSHPVHLMGLAQMCMCMCMWCSVPSGIGATLKDASQRGWGGWHPCHGALVVLLHIVLDAGGTEDVPRGTGSGVPMSAATQGTQMGFGCGWDTVSGSRGRLRRSGRRDVGVAAIRGCRLRIRQQVVLLLRGGIVHFQETSEDRRRQEQSARGLGQYVATSTQIRHQSSEGVPRARSLQELGISLLVS